jgi:hypothetical protein
MQWRSGEKMKGFDEDDDSRQGRGAVGAILFFRLLV